MYKIHQLFLVLVATFVHSTVFAATSINDPIDSYKGQNIETQFLNCEYNGAEYYCHFLVENISTSTQSLSSRARDSYITTTDGRRIAAIYLQIGQTYSSSNSNSVRKTLFSQYALKMTLNFGEIASAFVVDSIHLDAINYTFTNLAHTDLTNVEHFPQHCRSDRESKTFSKHNFSIALKNCGRENNEVVCNAKIKYHGHKPWTWYISARNSYLEDTGGRRITANRVELGDHSSSSSSVNHTFYKDIEVNAKYRFGSVSSSITDFEKFAMGVGPNTGSSNLALFRNIPLQSSEYPNSHFCDRNILDKALIENHFKIDLKYCHDKDSTHYICKFSAYNSSPFNQRLSINLHSSYLIDSNDNLSRAISNQSNHNATNNNVTIAPNGNTSLELTFNKSFLNSHADFQQLTLDTIEFGRLSFNDINYLVSPLAQTTRVISNQFQLDQVDCHLRHGELICAFRIQNLNLAEQRIGIDPRGSVLYSSKGKQFFSRFVEIGDNDHYITLNSTFSGLQTKTALLNFGYISPEELPHINGLLIDANLSISTRFNNLTLNTNDYEQPRRDILHEGLNVILNDCDNSTGVFACHLTVRNLRSEAFRFGSNGRYSYLYDDEGNVYSGSTAVVGATTSQHTAYHTIPVGGSIRVSINFDSVSGLDKFQGFRFDARSSVYDYYFNCINKDIAECYGRALPPPTTPPTAQACYNQLSRPTSTEGTQWMRAKEGQSSTASYFYTESEKVITNLSWIGYVLNKSQLVNNEGDFNITVYSGETLPDENNYQQVRVEAQATPLLLQSHPSMGIYEFTANLVEPIYLNRGHHWISIQEPLDRLYQFGIEYNPSEYSSTEPTGAFQRIPYLPWEEYDYVHNLNITCEDDEFNSDPVGWSSIEELIRALLSTD